MQNERPHLLMQNEAIPHRLMQSEGIPHRLMQNEGIPHRLMQSEGPRPTPCEARQEYFNNIRASTYMEEDEIYTDLVCSGLTESDW